MKAQQMIQLHVLTSSLLCTQFGKEMKSRGRGFILNNSSISAFKDFPGIAYYGATKSYIKSFSRSLRTEMKYHGVQVTCLCPGATATNLYDPTVIDIELGKKLGIMISAEKVAKEAVRGLFADKAVVVPGLITKIMLYLAMLTPHWVIYQIRKVVAIIFYGLPARYFSQFQAVSIMASKSRFIFHPNTFTAFVLFA